MNVAELHGLLGYCLLNASIAAHRRFDRFVGATLELRESELAVLLVLQANEGVTHKALAAVLGLTPPSLR